jgi:hypothetical protein
MVYQYKSGLIIYNGPGRPLTPAPSGSLPGYYPPPPSSLTLKRIDIPREFPLVDYSGFTGTAKRATIFWTPNLNTDESGKAGFEFYTSDLEGEFTIVIQGLDAKTLKPIFYTRDFIVTKKIKMNNNNNNQGAEKGL